MVRAPRNRFCDEKQWDYSRGARNLSTASHSFSDVLESSRGKVGAISSTSVSPRGLRHLKPH